MIRNTLMTCTCLIIITSCASSDPMSPTSGNDLHVSDNNEQMVLSLSHNGGYAGIVAHGKNIHLQRIESDADAAVFENEIYTLYYETGVAVLERDGTPYLVGCSLPD
jgi:hypothetical protein